MKQMYDYLFISLLKKEDRFYLQNLQLYKVILFVVTFYKNKILNNLITL